MVERVRPAFSSENALQHWMNEQIQAILLQYGDAISTQQYNYSEEEIYPIVKERLQELKDGKAELVDGAELFSQIRTRYGIEA